MPNYSKIITVFNRIEANFSVDTMTYKGIRVWPLIRFDIASQLYWQRQDPFEDNRAIFERECITYNQISETQRKHARIAAEKNRAALYAEITPLLHALAPAELALLTIGFEYTCIDGRYYNRFYDPLKDIATGSDISCCEILTGFQGNLFENTFSDKVTVAKELIKSQQLIQDFMSIYPNKELITHFGNFLECLGSIGINVSVNHEILTSRLEVMLAQSYFFEAMFERIKPRLAFVVCYYHDTAMAFLLACCRAGVPAVDMQHSVICPDDWGWAQWNRVPADGFELLPRYFWAWGESFAEIARRWHDKSAPNLEPVVGGNVWIPAWRRKFSRTTANCQQRPSGVEKVVLYAAPFGDARMFPEIFPAEVMAAIRHSPPELKWLIRIHYKTDDGLMAQIREYLEKYAGKVDIHRSSEIQLYELFESVDYHVSQTCTTVIEAEEFDVPNIVVGAEGRKWYQNEIDNGYYLHARTSEELLCTLLEGRKPIARPDRLLCTETLDAKKALNFLLGVNQKNMPMQGEEMTRAPHIFTIETTLACDLHCPECAIGGGMIKRAKGFMTFDQYKAIADKIRPYAQYVYLHIWGEPMLNPDIFRMISYTAGFARTNISTNGMSLTREKAEALIRSGVSDILVSIDGATQEVYEQYRVGGNVRKAFEALAMLNECNLQYGNKVAILPQFVVFQHNQHEMEEFARRCKSMGLQPVFKAPYIRTNDSPFSYSDIPAFHRPHFNDISLLKNAMRECQNPREVFTVLEDGSVVVCCHDYAGVTCFGNIFRQEVMEVWQAPEYARFRNALRAGNAPDFCVNNCMSWFLNTNTEKASQQTKEPEMNTNSPFQINLCCGPVRLPGFINIDVAPGADMQIDLEKELLPFPDGSVDNVVCISAINYFSYPRAGQIIAEIHRILKSGGVARFATQDLQVLAKNYLERNGDFYFEKLSDGTDRFFGRTFADKLNEFFYGFYSGEKHCKYVYDFESLAVHFREAGFNIVEQKKFRESRIPGAERFDNRPEQMFFLEAVKQEETGDESTRDKALKLLNAGKPEQGWQLLLKALEIDPSDRITVINCAAILREHKRYEDTFKLYHAYLTAHPDDSEIRQAIEENQSLLLKGGKDANTLQRQAELQGLNNRLNNILPDRDHLDAAMAWLRRAQQVNPGGGVSAIYHMDRKEWAVDYPETTGYIISTFLAYAKLSGDARYRIWACEMGNWEVAIQAPEGGTGEPVGVYGLRPRIFNTGQVMLGWAALYRETGKIMYLDAACRAADWIIANLDSDGKWTNSTYSGPKAYKSRVSWALLELYALTGERRYQDGAERSIRWILGQSKDNGWFDNNSLSDPNRPWTHLIGYVLVGLLEICRLDNARYDREHVLKVLHNAARGMMAHYQASKKHSAGMFITLAATFDRNWQSSDRWTCTTGTAQVEFFLRRLARFVDDPLLTQTADQLLDDLKRLQFIDGIDDPNLFGGVPGSFPVNAPYGSHSIQNWAVKFYADSLLQRLLPEDKQIILG